MNKLFLLDPTMVVPMNTLGSGLGAFLPLGDIEVASYCTTYLRKSSYVFGISSAGLIFVLCRSIWPSSVNSGGFPLVAGLSSNTRAYIFSNIFFYVLSNIFAPKVEAPLSLSGTAL